MQGFEDEYLRGKQDQFQGDEELVRKTVHAAWEAAAKAAADYDAFVFADIGPISSPSGETEVLRNIVLSQTASWEQGAENFLFETNAIQMD